MPSDLVEAWKVNQAMNLLLLDALSKKALEDRYAPRTRTVASQFAHMHNIRVSQLERRFPQGLGDLKGFPRGAEPQKAELRRALKASDSAIAKFLDHCASEGKVKAWNGSPTTLLGYLIAHESHHRGLVLVSLRLSGTKLPKSVTYGIWYWSKKRS